jgi:hypothetical protein
MDVTMAIFCDIFYMSYSIMIWNWKWKKMLLSISFKYSYFKPIFNDIKKGLWKGTLIDWNCDTLVCFHPNDNLPIIVAMIRLIIKTRENQPYTSTFKFGD